MQEIKFILIALLSFFLKKIVITHEYLLVKGRIANKLFIFILNMLIIIQKFDNGIYFCRLHLTHQRMLTYTLVQ